MIFKIIYYQFYRFYFKRLGQSDPHYYSLIAMSGAEAFILMNLMNLSFILLACEPSHYLVNIAIWVVMIWINFTYFSQAKSLQIINDAKKYSGNHKRGVFISLAFLLFALTCMFFGPILGKKLLESCV